MLPGARRVTAAGPLHGLAPSVLAVAVQFTTSEIARTWYFAPPDGSTGLLKVTAAVVSTVERKSGNSVRRGD